MISLIEPYPTRPRVLRDRNEVLGILGRVEPYCKGLVLCQIGQNLRILPESLPLAGLVGKRIGVANIDGEHSVRQLKGE